MTSISRMYALSTAVEYIVTHKIPGDIVECGVWRGGSSMLAARTLLKLGSIDRTIYLYDTFEGMTEPSSRDRNIHNKAAGKLLTENPITSQIWAYASLDDVKSNMKSTGYPQDNIRFIKGRVEDTIPGTMPDKIAILRLDTDWFESTYHELRHLFPLLAPRGVLIVDDYGFWQGAKEAVDRYMAEENVAMLLNRIDFTGRIGVKLDSTGPQTS